MAAKVFALTRVEASKSGNLVHGVCSIVGRSLRVLYDFGVTRSFESSIFVDELCLLVRELHFKLLVLTPASEKASTFVVCSKCPMMIEGDKFKVNLICLPL